MDRQLAPRTLQLIGVGLLVVLAAVWELTGKESTLFVGAACGLISLGGIQGVRVYVGQERRERKRRNEAQDDPGEEDH